MRTILIIMLAFVVFSSNVSAQDAGVLDLRGIHSTANILLSLSDADHNVIGWGTGVLLYDYVDNSRLFLLTAKHVVDGGHYLMPIRISVEGDQELLAKDPLPLWTEKGAPNFLTYKNIDMALLPVPKHALNSTHIKVLVRSLVTYSDSVLNGDPVLLFGAAVSPLFRRYQGSEQFLVTSGTIALHTDSTYLIDQTAFPGMSGGLAFRQELVYRKEGSNLRPIFGYKAIGLVTSNVPELTGKYSQVIKMDYIDSILSRYQGVCWGAPAVVVDSKK